MNKLYLALLLGVSVILFGCTQQQTTPEGSAVQYVCADGSIVLDRTLCPVTKPEPKAEELSVETQLSVCTGMPSAQGGSLEDLCIVGLAAKLKDTSLCKKVTKDIRLSCYALVAEVKSDPDTCKEAELTEDQCYDQYARDKRDAAVCEKIKDISYKDSCYSNLASQLGDPALCDKILSVSNKDSCYLNMAQRFGDSSYCNKIVNSIQKQNCIDNMQGKPPTQYPSK